MTDNESNHLVRIDPDTDPPNPDRTRGPWRCLDVHHLANLFCSSGPHNRLARTGLRGECGQFALSSPFRSDSLQRGRELRLCCQRRRPCRFRRRRDRAWGNAVDCDHPVCQLWCGFAAGADSGGSRNRYTRRIFVRGNSLPILNTSRSIRSTGPSTSQTTATRWYRSHPEFCESIP